jgi:hypothetical protein
MWLPVLSFPNREARTELPSRGMFDRSSRLCEFRLTTIHRARTSGALQALFEQVRQKNIGQTLLPRRSAIVWRLTGDESVRWRTLLKQVRCCRRAALELKRSTIDLSH